MIDESKLWFKGSDRLCKVVELSMIVQLWKTSFRFILNVEFARKLRIYRSLKSFICLKMNPKEVFHNTAYSVQLPYIAGHSL